MPSSGSTAPYSPSLDERFLAWMRGMLPGPLRTAAREGRALVWRALHPKPTDVAIEEELPWCSSNVWERIITGYMQRTAPVVCEYGIGASTLHHVRNLLPLRGTY